MKATLIDIMGDDSRVVNAARVSFSKIAENYTEEQNEKLIKYLANHDHWTPFSHCQITMTEKVPIFVARQRFKHMVGFTYNEVSRRYVDDTPEFYFPEEWRGKPTNAKQGSSDEVVKDPYIILNYEDYYGQPLLLSYSSIIDHVKLLYEEMLKAGVAPEQARMVLPQSMYTEYYVTGSLAAWARAYKLRIDSHAQKEIQMLAKQWDEIIRPHFPISWSKLVDE